MTSSVTNQNICPELDDAKTLARFVTQCRRIQGFHVTEVQIFW